jgi:hypothetical protein
MTLKSSVIIATIAVIAAILGSSQIAAASTGFTGDDFSASHSQRPAINPDFDPDESCDLDAYQLKCIPGSEQDCPEGFAQNEDATCHKSGPCPEGYHSEDEDETGQCYLNSEGCISGSMVLLEREEGGYNCAILDYICDDEEHRNQDYCREYYSE